MLREFHGSSLSSEAGLDRLADSGKALAAVWAEFDVVHIDARHGVFVHAGDQLKGDRVEFGVECVTRGGEIVGDAGATGDLGPSGSLGLVGGFGFGAHAFVLPAGRFGTIHPRQRRRGPPVTPPQRGLPQPLGGGFASGPHTGSPTVESASPNENVVVSLRSERCSDYKTIQFFLLRRPYLTASRRLASTEMWRGRLASPSAGQSAMCPPGWDANRIARNRPYRPNKNKTQSAPLDRFALSGMMLAVTRIVTARAMDSVGDAVQPCAQT